MKKIGLALGSGGARGLAHILMFEVFEELGIKPSVISGSSIGAILGASYASGTPVQEIKEVVDDLIFHKNSKFWQIHKKSDYTKMLNFFDFGWKAGGLIKGKKFLKVLRDEIKVDNFEDLEIPLKVVATDYWEKKEVIIEKGDIHKAVIASFSLPGLFPPVECDNHLLIDGGMVNPLPYDIIQDQCDITIAIDVSSTNSNSQNSAPPSYEVLFSAFQIMQNSIVQEKLKWKKPDILINTDIKDIRIHEFMKAAVIYKESEKSKDILKRKLEKLLK
ncbi:MAG: patatin-like phospholipase family protein [Melioribacteraceae bacterium]